MVADLLEALELASKRRPPPSASAKGITKTLWSNKKKKPALNAKDSLTFKGDTLKSLAYGVGAVAAAVALEKKTGCFSYSLKSLNRVFETFVSDFATSVPLFTPEGQEPQPVRPSWQLPFSEKIDTPAAEGGETLLALESPREGDTTKFRTSSSNTIASSSNRSASTSVVSARSLIEIESTSGKSSSTEIRSDASGDLPHFFSSTKLLACLDLEESRELFESARIIKLAPEEALFHCGDDSEGGTYIVVEGSLGVFLHDVDGEGSPPSHTNTLQEGESVGDLDVVDGEKRSVTCVALEQGAVLVEISRKLFMEFVTQKPRALQVYLQQAIARLWRVAHFVLNDTLGILQSREEEGCFDIVPSHEIGFLDGELLGLLLEGQVGNYMCIPTGVSLYEEGTPADAFYILLKGKMLIETSSSGTKSCIAEVVSPYCIIGSTSYFSSTLRKQSVRALELCEIVAIGVVELEKLRVTSTTAFVSLLVAAARAMGPIIRKFISLGLNRVWLHAHDVAFRQGEAASCIYVTISGRMILTHEDKSTGKFQNEEIAGRGEAVGAVWLSGGTYNTTATCTRDSELVRMSRGAFQCISTKYPTAAVKLLEGMAQRLGSARMKNRKRKSHRSEVATVALLPINNEVALCESLSNSLKQELEKFGPTLLLSGHKIGMAFPLVAERLNNRFYRSKLTAWMAAQEEDYRFILMVADAEPSDWSKICVAQADCVLLISSANTNSRVTSFEHKLVWNHVNSPSLAKINANRVELVLVHNDKEHPTNTRYWLNGRPKLERHHHMIKSNKKDMQRLARWLAGKAVGLVLSGGGSRGLAHLGVLRALDDAGVPIDIVGGTSQGAFMAALFAQRLTWDRMFASVQEYASNLGSVRGLLSDLTLPIVSLFNGKGFSGLVTRCLRYGPTRIEDLWLRFFSVSTNLSKGEPSVHEYGPLAQLIRASMTVVGLLPPVYNDGDLLVDGGYLNNIPVDVMRTQMGVDTLIVVDVEDKDFCTWNDLKPYDNGLNGWWLLYDSLKSLLSRTPSKYPKYGEILNSLMFLSHKQQIRSVMRDFHIDLYMRPTGVQYFRLMDYHLMDRIVRDAYRYGWTAISEWQCNLAASKAENGDSDQALMRLRTRSISKIHSHDFVSQMRPSVHSRGMNETSVERIQRMIQNERNRRSSESHGIQSQHLKLAKHSEKQGEGSDSNNNTEREDINVNNLKQEEGTPLSGNKKGISKDDLSDINATSIDFADRRVKSCALLSL